ncbi:MAG: LysE family translocator [Brevundimonas sp.]
MTITWLASLVMFSVVMSFTPGPNNLMVTSSGLTHGVRRTVPLILGVMAGFCGLMLLSALGVGALLLADPRAAILLKLAGAAYMLWLAFKLWTAAPSPDASAQPPLTAWHGALLQLVNPKAWMMAVAAVSIYVAPVQPWLLSAAIVTALIEAFSLASMLTWATFGSGLKSMLGDAARIRRVNRGMAILAAATALLIVFWS